jgi:hypothetical protein
MDSYFLPLEYLSKNRSSSLNTIERYLNDKIDFTTRYLALSYIHFYDCIQNVTAENGNNILKAVVVPAQAYNAALLRLSHPWAA